MIRTRGSWQQKGSDAGLNWYRVNCAEREREAVCLPLLFFSSHNIFTCTNEGVVPTEDTFCTDPLHTHTPHRYRGSVMNMKVRLNYNAQTLESPRHTFDHVPVVCVHT